MHKPQVSREVQRLEIYGEKLKAKRNRKCNKKSFKRCPVRLELPSSLRKLPFYWIIDRESSSVDSRNVYQILPILCCRICTLFSFPHDSMFTSRARRLPNDEFSDFSSDSIFHLVSFSTSSELPANESYAGHIRECRGQCKSVAWLNSTGKVEQFSLIFVWIKRKTRKYRKTLYWEKKSE